MIMIIVWTWLVLLCQISKTCRLIGDYPKETGKKEIHIYQTDWVLNRNWEAMIYSFYINHYVNGKSLGIEIIY